MKETGIVTKMRMGERIFELAHTDKE